MSLDGMRPIVCEIKVVHHFELIEDTIKLVGRLPSSYFNYS